ncbi:MAG: DUF2207 domain-containing protein [bacterium]|nr:DUF2207 domain-containing protein [bacterium]
MFFKKIFIVFILSFLGVPFLLDAQTDRSYFYENISQKFTVHEDTSVDVTESQTYNFIGEYHKGWRSIPLQKVSDITDISIVDGAFGVPLQYVSKSLEKTDPASWGKYTYRKNGGNLEIEWYFDARDSSRTWILNYKLIGAISFLKDKDELYWNLFTDYDVSVRFAEATVIIPENTFDYSRLAAMIYDDGEHDSAEVVNNRTFHFAAGGISPNGDVTIAAGWPKGIIDRSAFWRQFLLVHVIFILSILIVLLTIMSMALYWYFTEKRGKGRGTIVPEYEPPRNLKPAMAEVIVKEQITSKAWAATVIDLAVRGYVTIKEEEPTVWNKVALIIPLLMASLLFTVFFVFENDLDFMAIFLVFILIVITFRGIVSLKNKGSMFPKEYIIKTAKRNDELEVDKNLEEYERKFLDILLVGGIFSTREMKRDHMRAQALYKQMNELKEELYKETEDDTKVYERPLSREKYKGIIILGIIIFSVILISLFSANLSIFIPIIVLAGCAGIFLTYVKFEARLSKEGAVFREEWLGFKLYLETAEKYRMQNLTPEIFEKYLPYAIIFGVEKQWGKAFEGISIQPPNWYSGAAFSTGSFGGASGGVSNFSAGAFSASFASSFTSAFSSSGGGGASGGGGGAGGGGGGGGGGAS